MPSAITLFLLLLGLVSIGVFIVFVTDGSTTDVAVFGANPGGELDGKWHAQRISLFAGAGFFIAASLVEFMFIGQRRYQMRRDSGLYGRRMRYDAGDY